MYPLDTLLRKCLDHLRKSVLFRSVTPDTDPVRKRVLFLSGRTGQQIPTGKAYSAIPDGPGI